VRLACEGSQVQVLVLPPIFLQSDNDQTLAPKASLSGRAWYKNLIYAPWSLHCYDTKTLPGVREAIEDRLSTYADR
jgi:hypothetical protein